MAKKRPPNFPDEPGSAAHGALWRFGDFELDEGRRELRSDGQVLQIEPKPLNMLMLMLRHPGEVIMKADLMETLWTGRIVSEAVLTNCVAKLRLVVNDAGQTLIKTIHGYGYRFDGEVELVTNFADGNLPSNLDLKADECVPGRPEWKLVRRLGNHGDVWLAEQATTSGPPVRHVFKLSSDPKVLSSLKREVTIFRYLQKSLQDQTGIATIVDWHFDEPPWFVASEFVEGGNLIEWLDAQGGANQVALSERIHLIVQVSDSLSKIHQLGVLHKDLKPANILIATNKAQTGLQVLLADFGSGEVLDRQRLAALQITQLGGTQSQDGRTSDSGTLVYYAPEVIRGQPPTAKADIYALGVILFQLVVGDPRRPLGPGWERSVDDELLRQDIAECADSEPDHRLDTAAELSQRLRTLEERRALLKRQRADALEKGRLQARLERESIRRRWMRLALASLVLGMLCTGLLYLREAKARTDAEAAEATARQINRFINDYLLGGNDPYTAGVGQNSRIGDLVQSAAQHLDTELMDQPAVYSELSLTLGRGLMNVGLEDQARLRYQSTLAYDMAHLGPQARLTQETQQELATLRADQGYPLESENLYRASLESCRHAFGESDHLTFDARDGVAWARSEQGYFVEAAHLYSDLLNDMRAAGADSTYVAYVDWYIGEVQLELNQWQSAESLIANALRVSVAQNGANHPETLWIQLSQTRLLMRLGRLDEASKVLADVRRRASDTLNPSHDIAIYTLNYQANLALLQHRPAEAISLLTEASQRERVLNDETHYLVRLTKILRSEAYLQLGKAAQARADTEQLLAAMSPVVGDGHPDAVEARLILAEAATADNDYGTAEHEYRQALAAGAERMPADNWRLILGHIRLGQMLLLSGRVEQATAELQAVKQNLVTSRWPNNTWMSEAARNLEHAVALAKAKTPTASATYDDSHPASLKNVHVEAALSRWVGRS